MLDGISPKPKRDMVATDGQKLTLGDTTLTFYLTPGHTLGTVSILIPVKDNGKPHLVFSYSWGSGIHRSQVGALDPFAKEPKAIAAAQSLVLDFVHDWSVRAIDEKTVRVEGGGVSFGDLDLTEKDGVRKLNIRLPADLPEAVKKNIKTSEK